MRVVIVIGSGIICGLISTCICDLVGEQIQGSGIPELKTILSGINIKKYFKLRFL
jgi:hypothetical protein